MSDAGIAQRPPTRAIEISERDRALIMVSVVADSTRCERGEPSCRQVNDGALCLHCQCVDTLAELTEAPAELRARVQRAKAGLAQLEQRLFALEARRSSLVQHITFLELKAEFAERLRAAEDQLNGTDGR